MSERLSDRGAPNALDDLSPGELLAHLSGLGVRLSADGDRLKLNAPQGVVTPELQGEIAARKVEILNLIRQAQAAGPALPPLRPAARSEPLPLSLGQARLWSLAQMMPESGAFNMYLAFRLQGALDAAALEKAFAEIVRRHEGLRTTFPAREGEPRQSIAPFAGWHLPVTALQDPSAAQAIVEAEVRLGFDLAAGPLLRVNLLRLAAQEHVLIVVKHHIISDGWSWDVLLGELAALYAAFSQARPWPLRPLPVQYADYALWQVGAWRAGLFEPQLDYWRRQLAGAPSELSLPVDRAAATPTAAGARRQIELPGDLAAGVKAFSRAEGGTLYTTLLASFFALLHRHTGQGDLIVSSPVAGREQPEAGPLIGYLNNLLLLRVRAGDDLSLRELAARVRQTVLGAFAHQDVPVHQIVEQPGLHRLQIRRAMFSLLDGLGHTLRLPGLRVSRLGAYNGTATFDLFLTFEDHDDRLTATIEYRPALFTAETIDQLLDDLRVVLERMVDEPDARLGQLPAPRRAPAPAPQRSTRAGVAPRTPAETTIASIWQRLLGRDAVDVDANFFELSGTSLLALEMMRRIEGAFGRRLPLASLLRAPTVAGLARLIDAGGAQPAGAALVPIQPQGERRPLFVVHHGGGGIFEFANIARHLGTDQPMYGLQEPGFEAGEQPPASIEALAAHYLKEIRAVQPEGPYALGGFCFGGLVAYEMAQQLADEGQATEALFIIDAISPAYQPPAMLADRLNRHWARLSGLPFGARLAYLARRVIKRLRWEFDRRVIDFRHAYRLGLYRLYRRLRKKEPPFLRQYYLMDHNGKLTARYRARPYAGRAVLVRSQQEDLGLDYGWNELAAGGVSVCQMPTPDHLGMMVEPHARTLAGYLRQHLHRAAADQLTRQGS